MSHRLIPSLRAQRDLRKLGHDISIARKRRQFTQKQLAESASVNVSTIRRLENGDAGISLGTLAMVMLVLGESQRFADLLDVARDDVGLTLSVVDLPKRVRGPNQKRREPVIGNSDTDFVDHGGTDNTPEGW